MAPGTLSYAYGYFGSSPKRCMYRPLSRSACPRALPDPQSPDEYGNSETQDVLVKILRLEIGKKKVDEETEVGRQQLREATEAAMEELEKLAELRMGESDAVFDNALDDLNRRYDDLEEEIRKSKELDEAMDADYNKWLKGMRSARSEGLFFKSLYDNLGEEIRLSSDGEGDDGKKKRELDPEQRAAAIEKAAKVVEPAKQETSSTFRMWLFGLLSTICGAAVLADITSDAPSPGKDALYAAIATAMAVTALMERRRLE